MNIDKFKPSNGLVLLKIVKEELVSDSGLVLKTNVAPSTQKATVVCLGDNTYYKNKPVPYAVEVGDLVLFDIFKQIQCNLGLENEGFYTVIHEDSIIGILDVD